jgi:diaminobutyrate-2-oxoglutarate transaminase
MTLETIERLESQIRGYVRSFPTVFESASGALLRDTEGRTFIDFFAGAGTLNYGHNNPKVVQSLIEYLQRNGVMHGLDTATTAKVQFLESFESYILKPRGLDYRVQFTGPTGTNAVEAAIKLARKKTHRSHIIAFTNAYHGHSLGSLALTGNQYYHDIAYGSHNNVSHLPFDGYLPGFDSSDLLEKMLRDGSSGLPLPAAVILETVQGEGGINVASTPWLRRVADLCKRNGVLLIVDDIQVGNGRTGKFFSFEDAGIRPDLVCLSKAIGGGLPMSLVLISPEHDIWKPGQHTGTFRGNNLAFVAAKALLDYWQDGDVFERAIDLRSRLIVKQLMDWSSQYSDYGFRVRGRGMVWGIEFPIADVASRISREAFQSGLIIETAGAEDQVVKLLPPLTIEIEQLGRGLQILGQATEKVLGGVAPIKRASVQAHPTQTPIVVAPMPVVSYPNHAYQSL